MQEVRALLDEALQQERSALFPDPSDDARFREQQLDELPRSTAQAVQELRDYDWCSPQARETYEQIGELLKREVLDQQFRGMKQALESPDPQAMQRVKDMIADLNAMLAADARGEDTDQQFADFMDKHGEFFPDDPQSLEELVDSLARRAAAAERMMNSPDGPAAGRSSASSWTRRWLTWTSPPGWAALRPAAVARPDDWSGRAQMTGEEGLGVGDATTALEELADLEASTRPSASATRREHRRRRRGGRAKGAGSPGGRRRRAAAASRARAQEAGLPHTYRGPLELTAKAVRRLGRTALRRVFSSLDAAGAAPTTCVTRVPRAS